MFDFPQDFLSNFLTVAAVVCVSTSILIVFVIYYTWRKINSMTTPDVTKLNAQFEKMQKKDPDNNDPKLVKRMIHRQALKSGMVGAITSIGGFYTLPIALPVDIYLSTQIQGTLVEFIAAHYGQETSGKVEKQVKGYLITTGSAQITERSIRWLLKYATRLSGKTFAKFIPFIGAFIGFAVNYSITRTTGEVAMQWYNNKQKQG